MSTIKASQICWGIKPEWATMPIQNIPSNAQIVRRRFRKMGAASAFLRTKQGLEEWVLGLNGDGLILLCLIGLNAKALRHSNDL